MKYILNFYHQIISRRAGFRPARAGLNNHPITPSLLMKQWGKEIDRYRDIDLISMYHRNIVTKDPDEIVDERTWSDLDFDSVFSKMDRNTSCTGQQYLYHFSINMKKTNQCKSVSECHSQFENRE